MSTSHEKRRQHLSLAMFHAGQGPPELHEFIQGCIEGNTDKVSKHIKSRKNKKVLGGKKVIKVDITEPVLENTTALFLSCQGNTKGHALVVRHLIKRGAPIRNKKSGRTGLHRACSANAVEVVREWLGLYPNALSASSFDGSTPLSLATQCGSIGCVELLIKNGVDPDDRAVNKSTAIFLACATNNVEILTLLLGKRAQADPEIPNQDGETPLFTAASQGFEKIVRILLEQKLSTSCVNSKVDKLAGQTALIAAARRGNVSICQLLLDNGADIETPDHQGRTALYAASQEGHIKTVNLLLQLGADLEPITANETTPLSISAKNGHLQVFEALIAEGANILITDSMGRSLFEIGCLGGDGAILGSLVKHGAREKRWYVKSDAVSKCSW